MRESLYLEGNKQIAEVLKKLPAFQAFSNERLMNLLRLTKMRTFLPEEYIITEGEFEKCMYLLISGSVIVSKDKKVIASLNRAGDIFGEMSILEEKPRSATVTAVKKTSCLVIDAEYLESLNDIGKKSFHSAIYQMFAQILAYRLRVTTENYTEANREIEKLKNEIAALKKSTE